MTQEQYGMWLCSIEGIGSQTIRKLINRFGTPEEVYTRTEEQLKEAEIGDRERKLLINGKRQFHYRAMKQKISSYDMDVISYFSERYPEKLRHIPDFPKRLYWRGKLPREELQIAIVGARNCSHYGRDKKWQYENETPFSVFQFMRALVFHLKIPLSTCFFVKKKRGRHFPAPLIILSVTLLLLCFQSRVLFCNKFLPVCNCFIF